MAHSAQLKEYSLIGGAQSPRSPRSIYKSKMPSVGSGPNTFKGNIYSKKETKTPNLGASHNSLLSKPFKLPEYYPKRQVRSPLGNTFKPTTAIDVSSYNNDDSSFFQNENKLDNATAPSFTRTKYIKNPI